MKENGNDGISVLSLW